MSARNTAIFSYLCYCYYYQNQLTSFTYFYSSVFLFISFLEKYKARPSHLTVTQIMLTAYSTTLLQTLYR